MTRVIAKSMALVLMLSGPAWANCGSCGSDKAGKVKVTCTGKGCGCLKCKGFERLFDGKTLKGWEGDEKLWKVKDGLIVGRSNGDIKHNHFLCTTKKYGDFILYIKFRLVDGKGNSGFQIRSTRHPDYVLKGYQADVGARYWGWLYDEKRRGKLATSPPETKKHYDPKGWNEYLIKAVGPNIELELNGFVTVKYTEKDATIPREGLIGPQLHKGPPMEIQIKEAWIKKVTK